MWVLCTLLGWRGLCVFALVFSLVSGPTVFPSFSMIVCYFICRFIARIPVSNTLSKGTRRKPARVLNGHSLPAVLAFSTSLEIALLHVLYECFPC